MFVPVDEYLATSYEPPCEYVDGQLIQKALPTWQHGILQAWIASPILNLFPRFVVGSEVRAHLRPTEFRLPDILVDLPENVNSSYAERAAYLGIEILSPEDRLGAMFEKCERYHDWGVPHCWIIDPRKRKAWSYPCGGEPANAVQELRAGEIALPMAEIFSRGVRRKSGKNG